VFCRPLPIWALPISWSPWPPATSCRIRRGLEARRVGRPPKRNQTAQQQQDYTLAARLEPGNGGRYGLLLFLNVSAGISLISQESPIFQEIAKVSAIVAGGMVGIVSIGNAVGRIFWAWTSDVITRRWTFVAMFLVQVGLFWAFPGISTASLLTLVSFIILMCYGGGFGTMPAFTADYFGSKNVGPIYGLMLTAWGSASAFGPLLIAHLRQSTGSYVSGLHVIAGIMAVSVLLPILVSPPKVRSWCREGGSNPHDLAIGGF
jgi:OFA family oxalate/formate antiporter-like MFS transporter